MGTTNKVFNITSITFLQTRAMSVAQNNKYQSPTSSCIFRILQRMLQHISNSRYFDQIQDKENKKVKNLS